MVTRSQYAQAVLSGLGQPDTAQAQLNLLQWMQGEGGQAAFNPLNTTLNYQLPGESNYNSSGVQNYPNYQAGVAATVQTLQSSKYAQVVQNLNSPTSVFDQAVTSSPWGTKNLTANVPALNATVSSNPGGIQTSTGAPGSAAPTNFKWYEPWTWGSLGTSYAERGGAILVGIIIAYVGLKMAFGASAGSAVSQVVEVPSKAAGIVATE